MADSPYQQNIVKRYYENRDTLAIQNLGEVASDLFLCQDPQKADRLWDRIAKALKHTDAQPAVVEKILADRDVEGLTRLIHQLSSPDRSRSTPPTPPQQASHPTAPGAPPGAAATGTPEGAAGSAPRSSSSPTELAPTDPQVLKMALKAFRKRLKLTRLDEESKLGVGPLTTGKPSGVVAITPPNQFPLAVWEELVKQGKLKRSGSGFYALIE